MKSAKLAKKTRTQRVAKKAAGPRTTASRSAPRKVSKPRKAGTPRLLSGGNPQIAKVAGDAPVQAYLAAVPGWKRDIALRLDALITGTVPGVRKAVKWNSPFYGVEGRGWFVSFHCFTNFVKVTFFRGSSLTPVPPGESRHQDVRYYDVREGQLDEAQFAAWAKQASEMPGWVMG